jgi:hypothetical protein
MLWIKKKMAEVTSQKTSWIKTINDSSIKANLQRACIAAVSERLLRLYQEIRAERTRLVQAEYRQANPHFSAFGEIEVFADSVAGIASDIIKTGQRPQPEEAFTTLQKCNIFTLPEFMEWFATYAGKYPGYALYVTLTDYLRKLVLEYLLQYQLSEPDQGEMRYSSDTGLHK